MSVFQSTTALSWPLPLKTNAGRQPPFIMTIGEAAKALAVRPVVQPVSPTGVE